MSGVFLGMALLSKLSAVFLPPILGVLLVVDVWWQFKTWERKERRRLLVQAATALLVAALVLNAGYAFQGTCLSLGGFGFKSGPLATAQRVLPGALPVPFPEGFVLGIDHALRHDADLPEGSFFLLGELSSTGWWYYFIIAFLVKVPIPLLVGLLVATWLKLQPQKREGLREELFLAVPALGFFAALSAMSSLNIGFRHILMVLPFAFVSVSHLARLVTPARRWVASLFVLMGLWYASSALRVYPDHLAYFNGSAGGPDGGRRVLVDSNLDWGQDLPQLRAYLDERGNPEIAFAYFGRTDPRVYGISYRPIGMELGPGLTVVSVTFLQGRPYLYPTPSGEGQYGFAPAGHFSWLREHEPIACIGHTLLVYESGGD